MNSLGKFFRNSVSRVSPANVNNASQKSLHTHSGMFSLKGRDETRIAALSLVHKTCFNTSKCEEKMIEEVGFGMGDPSFNPSPS